MLERLFLLKSDIEGVWLWKFVINYLLVDFQRQEMFTELRKSLI